MNKYLQKYYKGFFFATFWIVLDQWTKHTARTILDRPIDVLPILRLSGVWNPGISFGLFPCHSSLQKIILSLVSIMMIVFLIKEYTNAVSSKQQSRTGLLFIIAGACGNLWDRLIHGHVFDFINVHFRSWDFPVFNLADMLITTGFVLLIIQCVQKPPHQIEPSRTPSLQENQTNRKNN